MTCVNFIALIFLWFLTITFPDIVDKVEQDGVIIFKTESHRYSMIFYQLVLPKIQAWFVSHLLAKNNREKIQETTAFF